MIDRVKVKKLKINTDDRGRLMEILRKDDSIFEKFGQVYITTVKPGFVKAWHYHKKQTDNFTCINGKIRLGLYDARKKSKTKGKTQEFILSFESQILVQIPNGVLHGFECVGKKEAMIVNVSTMPYNRKKTDEFRINPFNNNIPFKWNSEKGG